MYKIVNKVKLFNLLEVRKVRQFYIKSVKKKAEPFGVERRADLTHVEIFCELVP